MARVLLIAPSDLVHFEKTGFQTVLTRKTSAYAPYTLEPSEAKSHLIRRRVIEGAQAPLGLAYLASSLEQDGHEVRIKDLWSYPEPVEEVAEEAAAFRPDWVGLSAVTCTVDSAAHTAKVIKERLGKDVPIVVGGPHISALPHRSLQEYPIFDVGVRMEGEVTVRKLAAAFEQGKKMETVRGIVYRENGHIRETLPQDLLEDIDQLPMPAWHLLTMDGYLYRYSVFHTQGRRAFSMFSARGCPARCAFCDSHITWTRKYRAHSAQRVVDEMQILHDKYNIRHILFCDDIFIIDRKRTRDICNMLLERGLELTWSCLARVDFMSAINRQDRELYKLIKKAGCMQMFHGIESGCQETLDRMHKGITLPQVRNAVKLCKQAKIRAGGFFIIGFPHETEAHIWESFRFAMSLRLDNFDNVSILTPYPGTEYWHICKAEGLLLTEDWSRYYNRHVDDLPVVKTRHLDQQDLVRLKKEGDRLFELANRKATMRIFLRNPHQLMARFLVEPSSFLKGVLQMVKLQMTSLRHEGLRTPPPPTPAPAPALGVPSGPVAFEAAPLPPGR